MPPGRRARPGRNYDALYLLGLATVAGIGGLAPGGEQDIIAGALPAALLAQIYHVMLIVGGMAGIVGVLARRVRLSVTAEISGRLILGCLMAGYIAMLALLARPVPWPTMGAMGLFGLVAFARSRQIWRDVLEARDNQERSRRGPV